MRTLPPTLCRGLALVGPYWFCQENAPTRQAVRVALV
jgi:hypothetical protein